MTAKKTMKSFLLAGCLSVWAMQTRAVEYIGLSTETPPPYYQQDLFEATQLNTILLQLNMAKQTHENVADALEENEYQQKRLAKMDECNVKELGKYFEDAPAVWAKMKETFADRAKEMTLDFNASEPVNPDGSDEQTMAEVLSSWRLGRDILMDVYANPEKYGRLKAGKSFPLWKDQEYLYDAQLSDAYAQINAYFGEPVENAPRFGTDKYNRANAASIQETHTAYLAGLMQKYPAKVQGMPDAFKMALLPPKGLPPADEIVQYLGDVSQTHQVYPEWPQPWQEFIRSGFDTYNLQGEMAQDFVPKTFVLNEEASVGSRSGRDNRLNQHQAALYGADAARKNLELHEQSKKQMTDYVAERMAMYHIDMGNADLLDADNFERIANQIRLLKKAKIDVVRSKMAQYKTTDIDWNDDYTRQVSQLSPEAQMVLLRALPRRSDEYVKANNIIKASRIKKDAEVLDALEKDVNGVLPVAEFNAGRIDQLLKEHEAQTALGKNIKSVQEKQRDRFRQKEMELACPFDDLSADTFNNQTGRR